MKSAHVERQPSKMATPAKENIWFHKTDAKTKIREIPTSIRKEKITET